MLVSADPFLAEFDRLAQQVFQPDSAGMPMDVARRGGQLLVRLDVPGVSRDAIALSLEHRVLTVTAERRPREDAGEEVLVSERPTGSTTRRLRVPDWVDGQRVTADLADGVLTVVLPVAEQARPRRIDVRVSEPEQHSIEGAGTA